jgi:SulP family sulfate permease
MKKRVLDLSHFKSDLFGGLTSGVVALPLALAFGEQSGLGPAAGLYGAAFIAFFASFFGGTPTQISGPTAPMTALSMIVVAGLIQTFEGRLNEALPVIFMVFFLAGIFQIVLGVLKLGTYIRFIPYTVVSGFMTGIGVIILVTQIPPALGFYAGENEEVIEKFKPHAEELILDRETIGRAELITKDDIHKEALILAENDGKGVIGALRYLPRALEKINFIEFSLTLLTILIIFGFKKITTTVPSTLIALLLVSGGAYFTGFDYRLIQEIPTGFPKFQSSAIIPYLVTALMLALLGGIDSLLTSVVADSMTKTRHDSNKELIGQGIGNGVAALFGGLPGAGATIRTVVNIQAGGKTKLSGMISGVLLFVILILLGPLASNIPAAVLAGILITVGIGVMDYKGIRALPKMQWSEKLILVVVFILTVFWQLVYAVAVGLVLAAVVFLKRMSDLAVERVVVSDLTLGASQANDWQSEIEMSESLRDKVVIKRLNGPLFFGFTSHFRGMVSALPDMKVFIMRMDRVPFIDQSGVYALEAIIEELHAKDVVVAVSGANRQILTLLGKMKVIPNVLPFDHVFDTFTQCKVWLKTTVEKELRE